MPRGDGTGPQGLGPMTGRGAGFCSGYGVPGYANPLPRRFAGTGIPFAGTGSSAVPAGYGDIRPAYGRGTGCRRGRGRGGMRPGFW